jgi:hypothetical protein
MHEETVVLTRRRALQAGAGGAAAAFLLMHPVAARAVAAAEGASDIPAYLLRSSYVGLSNPLFAAGGTTLRLEGVADVTAAEVVPALRASEDTFALTFSGQLDRGIHEIRHSELGSFYLYVDRAGQPGAGEHLQVIVNRLPNDRRRTPQAASASSGSAASDSARSGDAGASPAELDDQSIRSVTVKRGKRGARCVVKLAPDTDVRELAVWLNRGDRVVAATSRRVKRNRVELSLKPNKRLRKGSYEVVVMASSADGDQDYRRKRLTLR